MSKILILYGSLTGNTEMIAQQIANRLKEHNLDFEIKNVTEAKVENLSNAEILILGCSTWDDGLLQADFATFMEEVDKAKPNLAQKKVAIFGLGDSGYPQFCAVVDILEKKFKELQTEQIMESLEIDGFPDEEHNTKALKKWLDSLIPKISQSN